MVHIFSPCVTYNKVNTYAWFRSRLKDADDLRTGDVSDYTSSVSLLTETQGLCTGVIYQNPSQPAYGALHPSPQTADAASPDRDLFQKLTASSLV